MASSAKTEQCIFTGGKASSVAMSLFLILIASSKDLPLSHSVTKLELAIALPQPYVLNFASSIIFVSGHQGLISLRRQGITHRDLSLENILIDENTHALVIDLGMCLRVPFSSPDDSRSGSLRLPLPPQGICGKPVSIYSTLQLFRPSISFTLIFVLYFLSEFYRTRGPIK